MFLSSNFTLKDINKYGLNKESWHTIPPEASHFHKPLEPPPPPHPPTHTQNGSFAEIVFVSQPSEKKLYKSTRAPKGNMPCGDLTNFKRFRLFSLPEKKFKKIYKKINCRCNVTLFKDSPASNCIYTILIQSLIKPPENLSETPIQNN